MTKEVGFTFLWGENSMNPIELDQTYNEFMKNLPQWIPEGIIEVNLALLEQIGLLKCAQFEQTHEEQLPHYFHVIETTDKVTLFNHQFVIWISPKVIDELPTTYVLIALISGGKPHLEIVLSAGGVYNTPKFILKLIRYYLAEVTDTENAISSINKGE